jgi:hypothetical protein
MGNAHKEYGGCSSTWRTSGENKPFGCDVQRETISVSFSDIGLLRVVLICADLEGLMASNGLMMFGATIPKLTLGHPSTVLDIYPPLEKDTQPRL